jgi:DNA-binding HxlR family transcriptional regulator
MADSAEHGFCPRFHAAVELIGGRWTGAIIRVLLQGRTRYAVLRGAIPQISDRMLSARLKELEAELIVRRIVTPDTPVRVEYELTKKGRALHDAVDAIAAWAEAWLPASDVRASAAPASVAKSRRRRSA